MRLLASRGALSSMVRLRETEPSPEDMLTMVRESFFINSGRKALITINVPTTLMFRMSRYSWPELQFQHHLVEPMKQKEVLHCRQSLFRMYML